MLAARLVVMQLLLLALLSAVSIAAQSAPMTFRVPCSSSSSTSCTARRNVPLYSTASLDKPSSTITSACVIIHGIDRDAAGSLKTLQRIASQANQNDSVLLLAPRFQIPSDSPSPTELFWADNTRWADGSDSVGVTPADSMISAFTVLDEIFAKIAASFPNLKLITVIGFSAGAQAVERYAAFSQSPDTVLLPARGIQTRYIVADPGSFTYLTPARARPSSLAKHCTRTPQACVAGLVNPSDFTDPWEGASTAPGYDTYKYGLAQRSGYPQQVGGSSRSTVVNRFLSRDIRYFVGADDTLQSPELDMSPEANAQGMNRAIRMAVFTNYLKIVLKAPFARVDFVPGCTHRQDCVLLTAGLVGDAVFAPAVTSSASASATTIHNSSSSRRVVLLLLAPVLTAALRWAKLLLC
ncbi:hypothetical protein HDU86_007116 [Geranomyces michiganensis]|nr:hypothetical protein HDU86_007116 [Geranomyces michiganensis]